MSDIINAEICLPIFKQGDDIESCIVRDTNDKINATATIQNYINLLHSAIFILDSIKDTLSVSNHDFEIGGDTHYIHISGNRQTIESLAEQDLVRIEEEDDDVEDSEDDPNATEEDFSDNDNNNNNN